ncbi:MAG: 2-octaprenyl-6-methoxyphenyl hydroxylase [Gammaproteobacteria bacterium]|nr:2-octaprenyl-6-methoxyphenyl hydroxylase [Gammaproteobacteria bacterium]
MKRAAKAKIPRPKPKTKRAAAQPKTADFDVLIAGGGMVGASLAAALAPLGMRIGVVEAVRFGSHGQPSYDERVTVVSWGSRRIFEGIGIWPQIASQATAIQHIHVSDRGHAGMTRMHAAEMGVEALGYVVPNRAIGQSLSEFLQASKSVTLLAPATLERLEQQSGHVRAALRAEDVHAASARLLVAADGAQSKIREQLGIGAQVWEYGQSAVICNLSVERPQPHTAFERFSGDGPMALLPMGEDRYALVWSVPQTRVAAVLAMEDGAFLQAVAAGFNGRFGRFIKAGKRQAYPLSLVRAQAQLHGRVVIVGNAAHSLHPIAGQGFNLSLRDVALLADCLADIRAAGGDPGAARPLQAYVRARRGDQLGTALFTDMLTRVFANPLAVVGCLRNLGLMGLELLPPARRRFTRINMGIAGRLPRLARGLPVAAASQLRDSA